MRLRRLRLVPIFILLFAGGATAAGFLLVHPPDFYLRCAEPPGEERKQASNEFWLTDFGPFLGNFVYGKGPWTFECTQKKLNSYFEEDFKSWGDAERFARIGVSSPRVEFGDGVVRLGFRYGEGRWSTIMNFDLKVWLAPSDANVMVVEIQRRRAGALPLPSQHLFDDLTELGRKHNIDISWYRHEGNPVAVVKFQSDRPRPTAQIQRLVLEPGKLTLRGVSFDQTRAE
jgi:hypothetical protein